MRRLRERMPELATPVTMTTRPPRVDETSGKNYFFVSLEEFESRKLAGELLAVADVHGWWYGAPREQVEAPLRRGSDVMLKVDVRGAEDVRRRFREAVLIFLAPPSLEDLEARLTSRRSESVEQRSRRMSDARQEMAQAAHYDYVVVNGAGDVEAAVDNVMCIVKAERLRIARGCDGQKNVE